MITYHENKVRNNWDWPINSIDNLSSENKNKSSINVLLWPWIFYKPTCLKDGSLFMGLTGSVKKWPGHRNFLLEFFFGQNDRGLKMSYTVQRLINETGLDFQEKPASTSIFSHQIMPNNVKYFRRPIGPYIFIMRDTCDFFYLEIYM